MSKRKRQANMSSSHGSGNKDGDAPISALAAEDEPVNDEPMLRFLSWCRSNGAHGVETLQQVYSPKLGFRTVITKADISPGEVFASIPSHMVLDERIAGASELGHRIVSYLKDLEARNEDVPNRHRVLLLSFLVYERFQRPNADFDLDRHGKLPSIPDGALSPSPWYPYLAILPETADDPLTWAEEEVKVELAGTNLAHYLVNRRADLRSELEHARKAVGDMFDSDVLNWKNWLWANGSVYSRAFPGRWTPFSATKGPEFFELGNPAVEPCGLALLPFLDMINHNPKAKVDWTSGPGTSGTLPDSGEIRVRFAHPATADPIPAGNEVFNNYGAKSNEEFLIGYGFVLPNNPSDAVRVLVNDARAQDPEFARKKAVLSGLGGSDGQQKGDEEFGVGDKGFGVEEGQHLFHLRLVEPLPAVLVKLMKCLCLATWELDAIDSKQYSTDQALDMPQVVLRAYSRLYELLRSKRDAIVKTSDNAAKRRKKEEKKGGAAAVDLRIQYRTKCAAILREGLQTILETAMQACAEAIAALGRRANLVHIGIVLQDQEFQQELADAAGRALERSTDEDEQGGLELDEDELLMLFLVRRHGAWLDSLKTQMPDIEGKDVEEAADAMLGEGSGEMLAELLARLVGLFGDDHEWLRLERLELAAIALQRVGTEAAPDLLGLEGEQDQDGANAMLVVPISI